MFSGLSPDMRVLFLLLMLCIFAHVVRPADDLFVRLIDTLSGCFLGLLRAQHNLPPGQTA